jgi:hypothetical protein
MLQLIGIPVFPAAALVRAGASAKAAASYRTGLAGANARPLPRSLRGWRPPGPPSRRCAPGAVIVAKG